LGALRRNPLSATHFSSLFPFLFRATKRVLFGCRRSLFFSWFAQKSRKNVTQTKTKKGEEEKREKMEGFRASAVRPRISPLFLVLSTLLALSSAVSAVTAKRVVKISNRERVRNGTSIEFWAYQIQGLQGSVEPVSALVREPYDMVVIEPTRTEYEGMEFDTAGVVSRLKSSVSSRPGVGKLVLAYVDIGQAEDWRWYWPRRSRGSLDPATLAGGPSYALTNDPDGWTGNYPVAYWTPEWQAIAVTGTDTSPMPFFSETECCCGPLFNSIIEEVVRDGFDGIYLDWVEAWENTFVAAEAAKAGVDPADAMVSFISLLRNSTPADFVIIQQNSAKLAQTARGTELMSLVDAIAQEGVFFEGDATDAWNDPDGYDKPPNTNYHADLSVWVQAGLAVYVCEYALNEASQAYSQAYARNYIPYVSRRSLAKLTTTPPPGMSGLPRGTSPGAFKIACPGDDETSPGVSLRDCHATPGLQLLAIVLGLLTSFEFETMAEDRFVRRGKSNG
jgi:cysteinyl-tRNA synthetase, unknown class